MSVAKTPASSACNLVLFTMMVVLSKTLTLYVDAQYKELALSCSVGSFKVQINVFNECSDYKTHFRMVLSKCSLLQFIKCNLLKSKTLKEF